MEKETENGTNVVRGEKKRERIIIMAALTQRP